MWQKEAPSSTTNTTTSPASSSFKSWRSMAETIAPAPPPAPPPRPLKLRLPPAPPPPPPLAPWLFWLQRGRFAVWWFLCWQHVNVAAHGALSVGRWGFRWWRRQSCFSHVPDLRGGRRSETCPSDTLVRKSSASFEATMDWEQKFKV